MPLRVGIVGAGHMGAQRARELQAYPDVEVTAVADPRRPARDDFAKTYKIALSVHEHKRLITDENVDVVYVCSPPVTHRPITVDALQAGRDVVCEHPMATNVDDARQMIDAADDTGRRLFIALPQRYDPVNQRIYSLIENDEIGFPYLVSIGHIENEYTRLSDWHDWLGTWDVAGGGVLMHRGTEMADLLTYLIGDVQAVNAVCTRFAVETLNKAEDTCMMTVEFAEDVGASVLMTAAARYSACPPHYIGRAMCLEVYGMEGAVRATSFEPGLSVMTKGHGRLDIPRSEMKTSLPTDMNRDFIDAILNDQQPFVTADDGIYALRVVLAGYKASQNKRRVELLEEV